MLAEDFLRFRKRSAHGRGDEIILRHNISDRLIEVGFESEVAVGEYADEFTLDGDRHAADTVLVHERERIGKQTVGLEEERVGDDAVLASLHLVDVLRLCFDGHILVDNAHAALARDRDCEAGLGDRVHCRAEKRNVEFDFVRKTGREVDVFGDNVRLARNE